MEGHYVGLFVASHNNIQLHHIICFVGSRRGAEAPTPCGIGRYYFPFLPIWVGRLVEVLLGALVGYLHDGKAFAFDARCEEVYHNSVFIQRVFRQECEKGMRRIG